MSATYQPARYLCPDCKQWHEGTAVGGDPRKVLSFCAVCIERSYPAENLGRDERRNVERAYYGRTREEE